MFIERYGRDLYETFIYWLREDMVAEQTFGSLIFFAEKGNKNRKRAIERLIRKNGTKELCSLTLKEFATREALLEHVYKNRANFGFYFDDKHKLHTIWR